jgi:D-alanyl-D-alanine carboxypeptidase/D-alanyl-D-alanine-endopeptidase (penicillin-binding protein 4)
VVAGLAALCAAPRLGRAAAEAEPVAAILARSGLGELAGFALADAATGTVLEAYRADAALPPASVAKVLTALYALEALGPGFRFRTRVVATGPVAGGVLEGDLALVGGGDPTLDTDALGELAAAVAGQGVSRVAGRFLVAEGALPRVARIEDDQPADAGYNPAIAGLNLNFNRVYLAWSPGAAGPAAGFRAAGRRFDVAAEGFGIELAERGPPARRLAEGREVWTMPRRALGGRGSVWLPVGAPGPYAGAVFRSLAGQAGLALPPAEVVAEPPAGTALAERPSEALAPMMRAMLQYSTNLTAEVAGLTASRARGVPAADLAQSAAAMTAWARARYGLGGARLVNHSGLTGRSTMTAREMLLVLLAERETLPGLLRGRPILDAARKPLATPVQMVAKTGTLHFASALAGYLECPDGRRLAFAVFAADPAARAAIAPAERDEPPGAAAWAARARTQQHALLRRWVALHAG